MPPVAVNVDLKPGFVFDLRELPDERLPAPVVIDAKALPAPGEE